MARIGWCDKVRLWRGRETMSETTLVKKDDVLALLRRMPDEIDMEDLQYRLYVLQKIKEGEAAFQAGDVVSQEELEQQSEEWLK